MCDPVHILYDPVLSKKMLTCENNCPDGGTTKTNKTLKWNKTKNIFLEGLVVSYLTQKLLKMINHILFFL